jgi:hypothetical protein
VPKYLIEVSHGADIKSCLMIFRVFRETGSHFLTNAEWGCKEGEHKAWFIIEADNREIAFNIVPYALRRDVKVTELSRFSMDDVRTMMAEHGMKEDEKVPVA